MTKKIYFQGIAGLGLWVQGTFNSALITVTYFSLQCVIFLQPNKAPVMVLTHGGGYAVGTAIEDGYSGVPLAAIGDVIIVNVNYRLGVFGFLSTGI